MLSMFLPKELNTSFQTDFGAFSFFGKNVLNIPDSFIPVVNHVRSKRSVFSDRRKYQNFRSSWVGDPAWYQVGRHGAGIGEYLLENGKLLDVVSAGGRGEWGFQNTKDHRKSPKGA